MIRHVMKGEENDPLWELLGRARPPEVSPFFARNVLRAVRNESERSRGGFLGWITARWRFATALGSVAALFIIVAVTLDLQAPRQANSEPVMVIAENPDYEVIADLDNLLASEDNSLWLEDTATF